MKKTIFTVLFAPMTAFAQTYPSPTFNSLTLQTPLTAANGGTGSTSSSGSGSVLLSTSPTIATPSIISPMATTSFTATGLVTTNDLAPQAANTVLANATNSSASPTAVTMPGCNTSSSALSYTLGTGWSCNTTINASTLLGATFASPGGIGSTTPSTGVFTTLSTTGNSSLEAGVGVGIASPGATFDVEAPNSTGGGNANSTLARFYAGSSGTPVTVINPTVAISRYEAINNIDTEGGQNAALYVEDIGNNTSSGINVAQVNGVTANVFQNGTGDSVGMFAYSTNSSTNSGHTAYGGFFDAIANSAGTKAFGLEVDSTNSTGANVGYSKLSPYPGLVGIHVQALGNNLNTAGIWIGNVASSPSYDVGVALTNDIKTVGFEDDSNSIESINITGSHSYGLVLSGGTYSGNAIQATNWQLSGDGMVRTSVTPASAWNTDSTGSMVTISTGSNSVLATGNGLILAEESINHHMAMYMCNAGSCALVFTNGTTWVASTATPAAGKMSIAYSGSAYAIYNAEGASETITVNTIRLNASN